MGLFDKITVEPEQKPFRVLLYGVEGIGKSTWASQAEAPIFVQTEDGIANIRVPKFPLAKDFDAVMEALRELYAEKHSFKTVVLDSADWLEKLIFDAVAKEKGVPNIAEIGYGKGYELATGYWHKFFAGMNALRDNKKMSIILIAHSKIERFENPSGDAYDRYTPRIHKTSSSFIREWVDAVLFANYKVRTKQKEEGFKTRVVPLGEGDRILTTVEKPSCMAKNRYNLPEEIPLDFATFYSYVKGEAQSS